MATTFTTTFLITLTAFDDRTLGAWSTTREGHLFDRPIQHIGQMDAARWADVMGSILPTDTVRICVTDRR